MCPPPDATPAPGSDEVDRIVADWSAARPDLDFAPLRVLSRVMRLGKRLARVRGDAFAAAELEPWEFDVLAALRRAGTPFQLTPKALLASNGVSSGTMTNRIDRLVERGFVERLPDPNDGRGVIVRMTREGVARTDQAIEVLVSEEQELLSGLSAAEQDRLAGLLRKLRYGFD